MFRVVPIMVTYTNGSVPHDAPNATRQVCEGFTINEAHRQLCVVSDGMPGPQDHMRAAADRIVVALTLAGQKGDDGRALALTLAKDDLDALAEYFAPLHDTTPSDQPNTEMELSDAVHRIRMLHERIIRGATPLPHHGYHALGAEGR